MTRPDIWFKLPDLPDKGEAQIRAKCERMGWKITASLIGSDTRFSKIDGSVGFTTYPWGKTETTFEEFLAWGDKKLGGDVSIIIKGEGQEDIDNLLGRLESLGFSQAPTNNRDGDESYVVTYADKHYGFYPHDGCHSGPTLTLSDFMNTYLPAKAKEIPENVEIDMMGATDDEVAKVESLLIAAGRKKDSSSCWHFSRNKNFTFCHVYGTSFHYTQLDAHSKNITITLNEFLTTYSTTTGQTTMQKLQFKMPDSQPLRTAVKAKFEELGYKTSLSYCDHREWRTWNPERKQGSWNYDSRSNSHQTITLEEFFALESKPKKNLGTSATGLSNVVELSQAGVKIGCNSMTVDQAKKTAAAITEYYS